MDCNAPKPRYKKRGPYNKRERKVYRFGFDLKEHAEIIRLLDLVPKTMRGEYVAESIIIARLRSGIQGLRPTAYFSETSEGARVIKSALDE